MKESIRTLIRKAIEQAAKGPLQNVPDPETLKIEVSRTKDPRFGDYASNIALTLAGHTKMKPRDLAAIISKNLQVGSDFLLKTEIAGPGFINFFLAPKVWHEVLDTVHKSKGDYGRAVQTGSPKILLEFVSANPTGPLHVGHGRGAAVGDTLARLLKTCGYNVDTEYYVNDAGNQMTILGRSGTRKI